MPVPVKATCTVLISSLRSPGMATTASCLKKFSSCSEGIAKRLLHNTMTRGSLMFSSIAEIGIGPPRHRTFNRVGYKCFPFFVGVIRSGDKDVAAIIFQNSLINRRPKIIRVLIQSQLTSWAVDNSCAK